MAVCWVILRGQQIYTVIQAVHSLLYIVAKCHFFSVVTWKDIITYLQKCEGCTHFCEILYISIRLCDGIEDLSDDSSKRKLRPSPIDWVTMVCTYSCKRRTWRWPMVLWYNVLDVTTLNAYTRGRQRWSWRATVLQSSPPTLIKHTWTS